MFKIDNIRAYLTTGAGVATAQLLSFFSIPFIAKLSGPETFGQYSFAISVYTIFVVLTSLRLEYSIYSINKQMLKLLRCYFSQIICVTALVLSLFSAMIFDNNSFISRFLLSFILLFSVVMFEFHLQNNILEGYFKKNALMRIIRAILLPTVFYISIFLGFEGVEIILLSFSASHIIPAIVLNSVDKSDCTVKPLGFIKSSILIFRKTKLIIVFIIPAHILSRYSTSIFVIVVGFLAVSKEELAYYALAAKFMIAPATIFIAATADVIKREVKVSPKRALNNFYKISIISGGGVVFASCLVLYLGEYLFITLMGSEWKQAALYAIALIPYMALLIVLGPITHIYVVLGKQKYDLYWQIFNMLFVSCALYFGLQKSLLSGVWYFSVAYAISIFVSACVCIFFLGKTAVDLNSAKGR